MITLLVNLLSRAYKAEARKLSRHAAKLGKQQAEAALDAVEYARKAEYAKDEAIDLGQEKAHTETRVEFFNRRSETITDLFLGDTK